MDNNLSLEDLIKTTIHDAVETSVTVEKAESIAFSRFDDTTVNLNTVADILNVHPDTARSYAKYGLLKPEPRDNERSPYRFKLSDVLKFRK
jgi:hypothetical protein